MQLGFHRSLAIGQTESGAHRSRLSLHMVTRRRWRWLLVQLVSISDPADPEKHELEAQHILPITPHQASWDHEYARLLDEFQESGLGRGTF